MANGKLLLAGVFVVSAAVGVIPLFLHDKESVISRLNAPLGVGSTDTAQAAGRGAGALGSSLGQYGDKALDRGALSGEEKMKLFEAEQAYYNALEEVLVQRYLADFFEQYQKDNKLADAGAAQAKYFSEKVVVAEAEIEKFLLENKDNPGLQKVPEDQRKGQVKNYLEGRSRQGVMRELVDQARASGKVKVAMARPIEPKLDVALGTNPAFGSPDAKITIVEFADYQCPFCARFIPSLKEILKKYDGKVKWVYRDFPLREIHPEAAPAAIAARCAGQQGKFWEAHGKLFDNYATLSNDLYVAMGKEFGLDVAKYESCRNDPATAAAVMTDQMDGNKYGVQGTPTYFVNGRKAPGDAREMTRIIEEELAKL
ncbi:MAG: thioredoxin domain-containing protein [Silvanigrellales bacterium]|jgi:protein-disulfide isomerase|nr:thioredoxin domain-containing protein [Silvanigrellales bacterium]